VAEHLSPRALAAAAAAVMNQADVTERMPAIDDPPEEAFPTIPDPAAAPAPEPESNVYATVRMAAVSETVPEAVSDPASQWDEDMETNVKVTGHVDDEVRAAASVVPEVVVPVEAASGIGSSPPGWMDGPTIIDPDAGQKVEDALAAMARPQQQAEVVVQALPELGELGELGSSDPRLAPDSRLQPAPPRRRRRWVLPLILGFLCLLLGAGGSALYYFFYVYRG
jgi:hypothetical protein